MSINRVDFNDNTKMSLDFHYDSVTDAFTTIRNQDTTELERDVQMRREQDDGTYDDDYNVVARLPLLLVEKWKEEINGEDIMSEENIGFLREKLNSAEAKQYIIKDGYIL